MSNTKRKIRRRRQHLEQHWDLIATKALLLGDYAVERCISAMPIVLSDKTIVSPTIWMLQQMNITPTATSRVQLRNALMRTRQ